MSQDWLEQLRNLHEADKARRQPQTKQPPPPDKVAQAADLLRRSKAHELLRQVQKALLGGQGLLDISDTVGQYDRVITLVWQGPISAARKPNPDDPEPYFYILVGVHGGELWVNGKRLASATPGALKAALLEAGKHPGRQRGRREHWR